MRLTASSPELSLDASRAGGWQEQLSASSLKEARKRAELDALALSNRIRLLKKEGERACRRVDDTWANARVLAEVRLQAISDREKDLQKRDKDTEKRLLNEHVKAHREHRQQVRDGIRNAMLETKMGQAQALRDTSRLIRAQKEKLDSDNLHLLRQRSTSLKHHVVGPEATRAREESRLAQLRKNREVYNARQADEIRRHEHTESKISQMEKEEQALIEWLQNKQAEQYNAYEALEKAASISRSPKAAKSPQPVDIPRASGNNADVRFF